MFNDVFFILGLLLIVINLSILYSYRKKEQDIKSLENNIKNLNTLKLQLAKKIETLNQKLEYNQREVTRLAIQKKQLQQQSKLAEKNFENIKLKNELNLKQHQTQMQKEYDQINHKKKQIEKEQSQLVFKINQLRQSYAAISAAYLKDKEKKEKEDFYKINLSQNVIDDIIKLQKWKSLLHDPSIVSKIIWSSYVIKPTSDMCNRILGTSPICGIYKITNIETKEIYIGQSVNISDRFKNHIKCGLGINASPTNKLYNNMQQYGVWNFSFEVLQKCSRDKLNEKERFWIDTYSSDKIGLNSMKGNK